MRQELICKSGNGRAPLYLEITHSDLVNDAGCSKLRGQLQAIMNNKGNLSTRSLSVAVKKKLAPQPLLENLHIICLMAESVESMH